MTWDRAMRLFRWGTIGLTGLTLLYLVLPTFVIVPMSFSNRTYLTFPPPGWSTKWYVDLYVKQDYFIAFANSLKIGIPAALLATVLGTLMAMAVIRGGLRGARLLAAAGIAPLMFPHIILALGLYVVMLRIGLLGSYLGIVVGHAVIAMPLVFITVSAALKTYPPTFEQAAMTLGANSWRTFWHVTFPMTRIGIFVGAIFAFSMSFDEIILALFLTNPETRTLPRQLWEAIYEHITPTIAAASTLVICFSLVAVTAAALIQRRGARADGLQDA
jgi:ABC-type spermidine/putrescine transport system permease subunit II